MRNVEKLAELTTICHDIQERSHLGEVKSGISERDLTFCVDLLSRTVLAFLEEKDLKNDPGMIDYIEGNIKGVCYYLLGKDYLSEE